jgi:hypothetical protein
VAGTLVFGGVIVQKLTVNDDLVVAFDATNKLDMGRRSARGRGDCSRSLRARPQSRQLRPVQCH